MPDKTSTDSRHCPFQHLPVCCPNIRAALQTYLAHGTEKEHSTPCSMLVGLKSPQVLLGDLASLALSNFHVQCKQGIIIVCVEIPLHQGELEGGQANGAIRTCF